MTAKIEVMDLLEALAVFAYNFRIAGQMEKAKFLGATEALLRTYFGCDQARDDVEATQTLPLN